MDPSSADVSKTTGRAATSCTECQRRKQKCSRQWPCDHCQNRKISHLCQFGPKASTQGPIASSSARPGKKRKRGSVEGLNDSESPEDNVPDEEDAPVPFSLKALGYHEIEGEAEFRSHFEREEPRNSIYELSDEIRAALSVVPPKPYLDALVENYIDDANYQYYPIYPSKFLKDYAEWWEDKSAGRPLHAAFTCLVLRVCAASTQYLVPKLKQKLQTELGENAQTLTERYHEAAQKLSRCIRPGTGGLSQVQQYFLSAHWFKSESMFVDSWHFLSMAIREAQEMGMHRDSLSKGLPEFDREMRRRMWCILYTWDRCMGVILNRPLIINDKSCKVAGPNIRLEVSELTPTLPDPITVMALEGQLCTALIDSIGVGIGRLSRPEVVTVLSRVDAWFSSLPPALRAHDTDTSHDAKHPWLILQRAQLHCIGHVSTLWALRPFLTRRLTNQPDSSTGGPASKYPRLTSSFDAQLDQDLRARAVDTSLQLLAASKALFAAVMPHRTKYFMSVLCPFDTATLLCAALVHDDGTRALPQREKVVQGIGEALGMLRMLCTRTRTGRIAWTILSRLVERLPLSGQERALLEGAARMEGDEGGEGGGSGAGQSFNGARPSPGTQRRGASGSRGGSSVPGASSSAIAAATAGAQTHSVPEDPPSTSTTDLYRPPSNSQSHSHPDPAVSSNIETPFFPPQSLASTPSLQQASETSFSQAAAPLQAPAWAFDSNEPLTDVPDINPVNEMDFGPLGSFWSWEALGLNEAYLTGGNGGNGGNIGGMGTGGFGGMGYQDPGSSSSSSLQATDVAS